MQGNRLGNLCSVHRLVWIGDALLNSKLEKIDDLVDLFRNFLQSSDEWSEVSLGFQFLYIIFAEKTGQASLNAGQEVNRGQEVSPVGHSLVTHPSLIFEYLDVKFVSK